ncbi:MAG: FtsQ-type POTRA domain-containing protein [Spirochaetota bacterium]
MAEIALYERDYAWRAGTGSKEHRAGTGEASSSDRRDGRMLTAPQVEAVVRTVLAIIAGSIAFALLAFFLVLPLTQIRGFSMYGGLTISTDEARAWSGLPEKAHFFTVDTGTVSANLMAHPKIAMAEARLAFPNRLIVTVTERTPIAVVYARSASGRMEAHCVDAFSVVFAPASDYPGTRDMPVISGVEIRGLRYGINLGGPFTALIASLAEVSAVEPALIRAISEIRMIAREGALPEIVLYPANYRLPVRMRPVLNPALLKSMMLVLDVVEGRGLSSTISELDLRSDTFVYRTKEAVSG